MRQASSPPARSDKNRSRVPTQRRSIKMSDGQLRAAVKSAAATLVRDRTRLKPLVLTGLMGVGKTAVGRRLAQVMKVKFVDSDEAIEKAAGLSISEIFEKYGEAHFRDRERAVIARLIEDQAGVIAIGGGAFVDDETRNLILKKAVAIWLKAPIPLLVERTSRRNTRPLLTKGDPKQILTDLLEKRTPAYSQAPIRTNSGLGRLDRTILSLLRRLHTHFYGKKKPKGKHTKNLTPRAKPKHGSS